MGQEDNSKKVIQHNTDYIHLNPLQPDRETERSGGWEMEKIIFLVKVRLSMK
jgi:hypothetical protein